VLLAAGHPSAALSKNSFLFFIPIRHRRSSVDENEVYGRLIAAAKDNNNPFIHHHGGV